MLCTTCGTNVRYSAEVTSERWQKEKKKFHSVASFIIFDSINFSLARYRKMPNLPLSSIRMHAIVQYNECVSRSITQFMSNALHPESPPTSAPFGRANANNSGDRLNAKLLTKKRKRRQIYLMTNSLHYYISDLFFYCTPSNHLIESIQNN